jgi:hypothetical protein
MAAIAALYWVRRKKAKQLRNCALPRLAAAT